MMRWLGLLGREGIPIQANPEGAPEPTDEQRAAMLRVPAEREPTPAPPVPDDALPVPELAKAAHDAADAASGKRPYTTPTLTTYGNVRDLTRSGTGSREDYLRRRNWR